MGSSLSTAVKWSREAMAYHGPSYGLSRECAMKAQAKFSLERALECVAWLEEVLGRKFEYGAEDTGPKDQLEFATLLKDGAILCELINKLEPGSVKKINTMKAPFKQRENIEMYLKGCKAYGLSEQDLFQTQKKGWSGPVLGVKMASENKRNFNEDVMKAGHSVIGLQYGSNKGASQAGMVPYGASRQIRPEDFRKPADAEPDRT